jgi:hypothetical protein
MFRLLFEIPVIGILHVEDQHEQENKKDGCREDILEIEEKDRLRQLRGLLMLA